MDNTNRGVLFANSWKEKESQPDYKGSIDIDGVETKIAAWKKTSQKGANYLSLSVQIQYKQAEEAPEASSAQPDQDLNDDIPF